MKTPAKLLGHFLVAALAGILACSGLIWPESAQAASDAATPRVSNQAPEKPLYYCPMHPKVTSDKPGTCPICYMDLVLVKKTPTVSGMETEGRVPVTLTPYRRQLIGVQVGTAERKPVTFSIRAVGRVEFNEKTRATVNLKYAGWIEELMVKAAGDSVRKGDPLFTIYSPDLYEAQQNYLLSRESSAAPDDKTSPSARKMAESLQRGARERLLLWDFTADQIKQIETTGEAEQRATVYSKTGGVVTVRNVVQGAYVEPGKDLFEIADLSTVWVNADIYEPEIPLVKVGQDMRVELSSMPGHPLTGKVDYIYPYLNDETRTVGVRGVLDNREGTLKPGMYATVSLDADLGKQVVVEDGAVLFTGTRNIVFIDQGQGILEPRDVTVGQSVNGMTVILSGLFEGEKVVTSGNFLVDSESRLNAALKQGAAPATSGHEGQAGAEPETAQKPGKTDKESQPAMPPMPGM